MKRIALIMLAVVSMALVSCGGGEAVQPADPAIIYDTFSVDDHDDFFVNINNCLQIKKVSIAEIASEVFVTVVVEMIKEPCAPICDINGDVEILDKNETRIGFSDSGGNESLEGVAHKGDTGTLKCKIYPEHGLSASEVILAAKYVRLIDIVGDPR